LRRRVAEDYRADAVSFKERSAPQDESAHHHFADVDAADKQSAKVGRIERIDDAPVGSRTNHCKRRLTRKIAYFSAERARSATGKDALPSQTVAAAGDNAPFNDEPHRHVAIADIEERLVWRKTLRWAAREANGEFNFSRG
jgi:hypothetical protein